MDGQQIWHPVTEPGSKVLWIDCHKTLTLKIWNRWHCELIKHEHQTEPWRQMTYIRVTSWASVLDNSSQTLQTCVMLISLLLVHDGWLLYELCPRSNNQHHIICSVLSILATQKLYFIIAVGARGGGGGFELFLIKRGYNSFNLFLSLFCFTDKTTTWLLAHFVTSFVTSNIMDMLK